MLWKLRTIMSNKVSSFRSLITGHAIHLCSIANPSQIHEAKEFSQATLSKIRFCGIHQKICATCERAFSLNEEKIGRKTHVNEQVILTRFAKILCINHHHNHDAWGGTPNLNKEAESKDPKVHCLSYSPF